MKPALFGIVLVIVLIVAGAFFYAKDLFTPPPAPAEGATGMNLYANGTYGISFAYPDGYEVGEHEGEGDAPRYDIVLIRKEDIIRVPNGEGPRAITISIYPGEEDLYAWLQSDASNLSLGSGQHASTTVAGVPAARYTWHGLYEGETAAFLHEGNIIAVSATSDGPGDQIRADYEAILAAFSLRQ